VNAVRALIVVLAGACAVVMVGFAVTAHQAAQDQAAAAGAGGTEWDAGNIFSDQVFYNAAALRDEPAAQAALDMVGATCLTAGCLRNATYPVEGLANQWCRPVPAESAPRRYAHILVLLAQACGLNPQVAIAMVQKESQGLTRPAPPAALTGFGCPDSGPGGSANCDPARAGVWAQTAGMFAWFARARQDAATVGPYIEGQAHDILWNVAETGCGAGPVTVKNRATASLYRYTPYQPNAASLAAYPAEGDRCSSYGNRNIFRLFQRWFGPTGGGKPAPGAINANVTVNGVAVTIPDNQYVVADVRGKVIQAPSPALARGLAAGFGALGLPYVWGGGGSGAGPNDGCQRGGGALNSCQGLTGFDCSGLTAYVLKQAGYGIPGESGSQRSSGTSVPYAAGLPGDIVGFPGHVALYLGVIDGRPYILEASDVGVPVHIVPLTRGDRDSMLHRYFGPAAA
jgi:cell wall-associated NlpC family hydrolase